MSTRIVHANIDTLTTAHESQPDTTHQRKAWLWLAEQDSFRFAGDALVVDSATWDRTQWLATPTSCTCPARKGCWHRYAALTVAAAIEIDAHYDAMAERVPFDLGVDLATYPPRPVKGVSHYREALADLLECFN